MSEEKATYKVEGEKSAVATLFWVCTRMRLNIKKLEDDAQLLQGVFDYLMNTPVSDLTKDELALKLRLRDLKERFPTGGLSAATGDEAADG